MDLPDRIKCAFLEYASYMPPCYYMTAIKEYETMFQLIEELEKEILND